VGTEEIPGIERGEELLVRKNVLAVYEENRVESSSAPG
jgi:hypothetical protein